MPTQWTDAFLDSMRLHGDEPADRAVQTLFSEQDMHALQRLMDLLVRNDDVPHADLPPVIRDYFASTDDVEIPDPDAVRAGQELFAAYGPEIAMLLACSSLPFTYSARKGVQVLYRTGYLAGRAQQIEVGPLSGKSNVVFWLEQHGFTPDEDVVDRVFRRAKSSPRVLTEQEILDEVHVAQTYASTRLDAAAVRIVRGRHRSLIEWIAGGKRQFSWLVVAR